MDKQKLTKILQYAAAAVFLAVSAVQYWHGGDGAVFLSVGVMFLALATGFVKRGRK